MCMPIRSRFLSARLYNYILNACSLQLFIHRINTLSTGSVKVFQIERCYADCPIHQCRIGQKFSWISRILPSYSFLLGVALTAQDVVAAPGHGLMARQLATASMLRFQCSQLVDRIDPLVQPGIAPSTHMHQIVGAMRSMSACRCSSLIPRCRLHVPHVTSVKI
jgi:hypothetical protein